MPIWAGHSYSWTGLCRPDRKLPKVSLSRHRSASSGSPPAKLALALGQPSLALGDFQYGAALDPG